MKWEEIEQITFNPVCWEGPYKLKRIEITSPLQNVAHCIRIEDEYFTKEYIKPINIPITRGRKSESFWQDMLKPFNKPKL